GAHRARPDRHRVRSATVAHVRRFPSFGDRVARSRTLAAVDVDCCRETCSQPDAQSGTVSLADVLTGERVDTVPLWRSSDDDVPRPVGADRGARVFGDGGGSGDASISDHTLRAVALVWWAGEPCGTSPSAHGRAGR